MAERRRGAAMVELAIILPLLAYILVASTDFARSFHDFVIVTDRARNAAIYASQNVGTPSTTVTDAAWLNGIRAAAVADSTELDATTQVTVSPSQLSSISPTNPYVSVTVTSLFKTVMTYPGIPNQVTISRTIRIRLQPTTYRMK